MLSPDHRMHPIPTALQAAETLSREIAEANPGLDPEIRAALPGVVACSDFVGQTLARTPTLLGSLAASGDLKRPYAPGEIAARLETWLAGVEDEITLKSRLRELRQREMARLAFRDLAGWATLDEVISSLSELADACVEHALRLLHPWTAASRGEPVSDTGAAQRLVVLGMGKLGGQELNFSSDIDLIFCYPSDGDTTGGQSNHEFFTRLGQRLIQVLSDPTADGLVFRVDMRLRPNGASGPLALSFDAMEHYYQTHGRDWERYAMIKARVIAGDRAAGEQLLDQLRPFVFRKYLDYSTLESIRAMKGLIEREMARKGMEGNIKLGRGGIREIEFVTQALQLIRGGREPNLQHRQLRPVLRELAARNHIDPSTEAVLNSAYEFLRRVEHRLQMIRDEQTQTLPIDERDRARVAFAMGFDGWPSFLSALDVHRKNVHEEFSRLFLQPAPEGADTLSDGITEVWVAASTDEESCQALTAIGFVPAQDALQLLNGLRDGSAYQSLSAEGRARLDRLVPLLVRRAAKSAAPITTLGRLVHVLESIGRRTTYYALMVENPPVLDHLVRLAGASPWIANWIAQHPIVLDELIDPGAFTQLPTMEELRDELRQRLAHIPETDLELQLEVLREFRHGQVLRVAAADIGAGLPAPRVGRALASIAEVLVSEALALATHDLAQKHGLPGGREIQFAVIGYGKLGSFELGYGSDLDLIYIYDAAPDTMTDGPRPLPAEQFYARLGQRLIHLLTIRTPGGILYEVDMRLRPSGKSGTLVASLDAFRRYQQQEAWTWEHQALVRARPIAGSADLKAAFVRFREEILCQERDPEKLLSDVRAMRQRMRETLGSRDKDRFDLKHDRGGIVDIEFMVQYAVLRWAHRHPVLARHADNIQILERLHREGLVPAEAADTLTNAYGRFLGLEHHRKLMESESPVTAADLGDWPAKVRHWWRELMNEE